MHSALRVFNCVDAIEQMRMPYENIEMRLESTHNTLSNDVLTQNVEHIYQLVRPRAVGSIVVRTCIYTYLYINASQTLHKCLSAVREFSGGLQMSSLRITYSVLPSLWVYLAQIGGLCEDVSVGATARLQKRVKS